MYDETRPYYDQMGYGNEVLERFWSKVDVKKLEDGSDDLDACMEWTAGCFTDGYGQFFANKKNFRSHRFIYECFNGLIPKRLPVLEVCHHCDTPKCVNPNHLWLGTNQENTDDMVNKDRQAKGSKNGRAILTDAQVLEIKYSLEQNTSVNTIANKYNVNIHIIYKIRSGQTWSDITGIKEGDYSSYMTNDQVLEITTLLKKGNMKNKEIAALLKICPQTVSDIKCGKRWSEITGIKRK